MSVIKKNVYVAALKSATGLFDDAARMLHSQILNSGNPYRNHMYIDTKPLE